MIFLFCYLFQTCMLAITVSLTIFIATLPAVPLMGKEAFTVWLYVLSFISSGNFTIMPAVVRKTYGDARATVNVGLLFTSQVKIICRKLLVLAPASVLFLNSRRARCAAASPVYKLPHCTQFLSTISN